MRHATRIQHPRHRQRGVVLIFTLIVMLILTIGALALMRSMNTSLFAAGNLSFRRDLVNQGEQAVSTVLNQFKVGGPMASSSATTANAPTYNYSSTALVTNSQGIPAALTDDTAFAAVGSAADLVGATSDVTMRYVVDRLCQVTGVPSSALCVKSVPGPTGGTATATVNVAAPTATVYRLSVRVSGPRSTQIFLQTTFTKPD